MSDPAEDGQAIQLLVRPDPTELTSVAPPTQTFRTLTDLGSRLTELLSSLKPDPHTQKTISRMAWTLAPPAWVWSVSLHPDTGLLEIAALTLVSAGLSAAVCSQMQHALRTGDPTHLRNVQCAGIFISREVFDGLKDYPLSEMLLNLLAANGSQAAGAYLATSVAASANPASVV